MKSNIFILLLAVFAFSCSEDDLKELTEISQDVDVSKTFTVNLSDTDPMTFSDTEVFDTSVTGINVSNVELARMTMAFSNYSSTVDPVKITSASLSFVEAGINLDLPEIDLSVVNGTTLEISLPGNAITSIQNQLLENDENTITLSATVDKVPVTFDVELTLEIKVTGNIL